MILFRERNVRVVFASMTRKEKTDEKEKREEQKKTKWVDCR
jgi:hypothetical protein